MSYAWEDYLGLSSDDIVSEFPDLLSDWYYDPPLSSPREPPKMSSPLTNVMVVSAAIGAIDPPQFRSPGSSKFAERGSKCYAALQRICTGTKLLTKNAMLFILERMILHGMIDFSLTREVKRKKTALLGACPDLMEALSRPGAETRVYGWYLEWRNSTNVSPT